jgi:site-specific recombinase XerD
MFLLEMETDSITADEFEECGMNWLTANRNKIQPKTTNRRLTSLRQFGKWAGWGYLFEDYSAPTPLAGQPHPLPEGIEGVKRMIEVCKDERHAALVALCGLCGLRIAEALAVKATDFDFHEMTLTIRGKGDKTRMVPVSSYAWSILQRPVARAYCVSDDAAPVVGLQDRFARALVTRLAERARLKRHVSSHDLRATFATEVYNKTLDQRLVQMLLGHASGTTTELYIGRTADQMKVGVELL